MTNTVAAPDKRPVVSVILPTFNRAHILTDVLQTICAQDYPRDCYEIIVVDNNSTDNTEAVISHFCERLKIDLKYVKETRPGLVFARHTGAANAGGEIVFFGDDDAFYEANWISAIIDVYIKNPQVGAVGSSIEIRWDKEPPAWVKRYEGYLGQLNYKKDCVVGLDVAINGGSVSIRKDILYAMRGFNPGQKGDYIVGDSETGLCRKLAAAGIPVGSTAVTTAWHFQLADKNGSFKDLKRRLQNNGICQAYDDTFYGRNLVKVACRLLRQAVLIAREMWERIRRADTDHLGDHFLLRLNELYFRVKYCFLYRFHPGIRMEIQKRDWEFTPAYAAPFAKYCTKNSMPFGRDE
ncbi:MAG: glycosyltransferase family 2 protein [Nitrospiraceae bacterium]|nr:glycosyltransferase family 2 protein [Nitrospiraceae bacterium]